MSLTRLFSIPLLASIFVLGCGKQPEAPNTQVAPKVSSTNRQPKQASLPPSVSVPVFTLQDFDSNSTDHNSTKKAIGEALGKSPTELTQEDLEQVEKLDLFALGITDISPLAALISVLLNLNVFSQWLIPLFISCIARLRIKSSPSFKILPISIYSTCILLATSDKGSSVSLY